MRCSYREEGIEVLGGGLTIVQRFSQYAVCAGVGAGFLGGWLNESVDFVATVGFGIAALNVSRDCVLYWIGEGLVSLGAAGLPYFRHVAG